MPALTAAPQPPTPLQRSSGWLCSLARRLDVIESTKTINGCQFIMKVSPATVAPDTRLRFFSRLVGIDYLREVVVDDKLGIGEELEARMQHVVDTYQDEWASVVQVSSATRKAKPMSFHACFGVLLVPLMTLVGSFHRASTTYVERMMATLHGVFRRILWLALLCCCFVVLLRSCFYRQHFTSVGSQLLVALVVLERLGVAVDILVMRLLVGHFSFGVAGNVPACYSRSRDPDSLSIDS